MKVINPLSPFKFWASKPLNVALAYLEKYGKDKNVLLDPFAGSGVFCFAGLLRGMKVIYNDLCPYGLFLARNAIKPINPQKIQEALNEVLKRPLPKDVKTIDGNVLIRKDTPVERAIEWLYKSRCDEILKTTKKLCNRETIVEYYVWDTKYYIKKEEGDEYAFKKLKEKDKRYRIFLDIICKVEKIEIDGKEIKVYTFSRKDINEKWEEAFEKNPEEWIIHSRRGRKEPGIVNEIPAILIRIGMAKRYQRYPFLKRIICPVHGPLLTSLNDLDWEKVKMIENIIYPFPNLIPTVKLAYKIKNKLKPFHTFRSSVFAEERLSTIEEEEWQEKIPKLKNYFTKRNLLALNILFWSINQVKNLEVRWQLYLLFIAHLHKLAKFESLNVRWGSNNYAVTDEFVENNALTQLSKSWKDIKKVKEYLYTIFHQPLNKIIFDESWNPEEFLTYVNEPYKKTILWLREDAKELDKVLRRKVVDVVFTDPPYKAKAEALQYFELTTFFTSWLCLDEDWKKKYGDFEWWEKEVIENVQQSKSLEKYFELLEKCFESIDKIVKEGGTWIITYHSPSKDVWEGIQKILSNINLKVPTYEEIVTHRIRATGKGSFYVMRHGSIGEDAYIVLTKKEEIEKETIKLQKELPLEEFLELVFSRMRDEIIKNDGIITWEMFYTHYPHVVITVGGPFGEKKSYEDLFESITIDLGEGLCILNRDKVGKDLYEKIYHSIDAEKLIRRVLVLLGKQRKRIPRSELELKILPKLDGRIDEALRVKVLKKLFVFDPISREYIFIPSTETLERFLPKVKKEFITAEMLLPNEIILKIKEVAKKYGAHKTQDVTGEFSLKVISDKYEYLINIVDESGIRRFATGTSKKEKENKIIVYFNYTTKEKTLKVLKKQLEPATFIVIPYEKCDKGIEAFRSYEPLEKFKKFVIK